MLPASPSSCIFQDDLVYWPTAQTEEAISEFEYRAFTIADGDIQYGLYIARTERDEPRKGIVFYLHGRGENHLAISDFTFFYPYNGWDVYALEYPGFNGLQGRPTEASIGASIASAYARIQREMAPDEKLVIHGNSLGAGPALQAAQYPHDVLILTAPVGNMQDLAARYAPIYPSFLLRSHWDNWQRARTAYQAPRYVLHSRDDMVVPYQQGQRLAEVLRADFTLLENEGHLIGDRGNRVLHDHYPDPR